MKFEEYVGVTIGKIAKGIPVDREAFKQRMDLFFRLIHSGMSPKAARNVMDLYV